MFRSSCFVKLCQGIVPTTAVMDHHQPNPAWLRHTANNRHQWWKVVNDCCELAGDGARAHGLGWFGPKCWHSEWLRNSRLQATILLQAILIIAWSKCLNRTMKPCLLRLLAHCSPRRRDWPQRHKVAELSCLLTVKDLSCRIHSPKTVQ